LPKVNQLVSYSYLRSVASDATDWATVNTKL